MKYTREQQKSMYLNFRVNNLTVERFRKNYEIEDEKLALIYLQNGRMFYKEDLLMPMVPVKNFMFDEAQIIILSAILHESLESGVTAPFINSVSELLKIITQ